jgi:ABC-2 type transport system ATP-binding protein
VIFSTHVMQHAERICDQVVLVAAGSKVFDGTVAEACASAPRRLVLEGPFAADALGCASALGKITSERLDADRHRLTCALAPATPVQAALRAVFERGLPITRMELEEPHLHDAFITLTAKGAAA